MLILRCYIQGELYAARANITLMMQADMLAYHAPGEPPQLGLPDKIGTPEVAQLISNISAIYSPELTVGFTPVGPNTNPSSGYNLIFHQIGVL